MFTCLAKSLMVHHLIPAHLKSHHLIGSRSPPIRVGQQEPSSIFNP